MSRDKCPVTPATRITFLALLVVFASVLVALLARRPPPVPTRFEPEPSATEWVYDEEIPDDPDAPWTDEAAASGARSLVIGRGEKWETPVMETDPLAYYRITYQSQAGVSSYLGIRFLDRQGEMLTSDCFTQIESSEDWRDGETVWRSHPQSHSTRIIFHPIHQGKAAPGGTTEDLVLDAVRIRAVRRAEAAAWADRLFATMPPLVYEPAPGRWTFLPNTMAALRDGGVVRVAVLGDSIACDTANSTFDVLVERHYPAARLLVIPSTRRNTGCETFAEEGAMHSYVLAHRPDLLMIGGINNRGWDAVRDVIRRVRAESDTEVLFLTPGFGIRFMDHARYRGTGTHPLAARAREDRVAFLDIGLVLGTYILESGKPYEWFLRDEVHPNDRGKQVLGRILERYFAPDVD